PGGTALARFDTTTGKQTMLAGGDREIAECSMSEDGTKIAYVATDATHPGEVYVLDVAGGASTKVSGLNDSYVASHALSGIERHTVKNSSGQPIEYWVMRPPQASPGKRYPTIVDIHGGPQTEFGNSFFHEFQFWVSRGYVVAFGNPRGSVGYGYQWTRDLEGNWGDPMFDDVMAMTNEVAGRADVDPQRLVVSGGSYGGYATLWVVGHTQRFKAAIAERVVSNLFTQLLGSDYGGSAPGQYSWGEPWTHRDVLWKQSPVAYVKNVRTPLLILHSDNDTRTPVDQTYEEFMALKSLARPVWLLEVPRDTHDLSRVGEPIHRVERLNLLADWLGKHV
ncbi:MAG: S9 family peptidase, partial [Candidatus Eremiobacteraeota bacterium]|nr:S9 family peptidase [Candidatus Eremiobacteraeota bacterium]